MTSSTERSRRREGRMTARQTKRTMTCPRCGSEMNHHAVKLADPRDAEEALAADAELGAIVTEAFTCPACGTNAARRE